MEVIENATAIVEKTATQPVANATTEPNQEPTKKEIALKKLVDQYSSEIADKNKQLKEWQDKGKSAEQLAEQRAQELANEIALSEQRLKESNLKLSKATAITNVAEAKSKINLDKESLKDFDSVFNAIVNDDENITLNNSTALNRLLLKAYGKGIDDAKLGNLDSHTVGITTGGSANNSNSSQGAKYAKEANGSNLGTTDLFTKQIKQQ